MNLRADERRGGTSTQTEAHEEEGKLRGDRRKRKKERRKKMGRRRKKRRPSSQSHWRVYQLSQEYQLN